MKSGNELPGSWKLWASLAAGELMVPVGAILAQKNESGALHWLGRGLFYLGFVAAAGFALLLIWSAIRSFVAGVKALAHPRLERCCWLCAGGWLCSVPAVVLNSLGMEWAGGLFAIPMLLAVLGTLPLIIVVEIYKAPPRQKKPKKHRTKLEIARLWCAWSFLVAYLGGMWSLVAVWGYYVFLVGIAGIVAWAVLSVLIPRQRKKLEAQKVPCQRCRVRLFRDEAQWWRDQPYCARCHRLLEREP